MADNAPKIIGICSADVDDDYNGHFHAGFTEYAKEFNFKILLFHCFSSLYSSAKHDLGERNIFNLINYELLDGLIILSESIKDEKTRQELVDRAHAKNIPVICIDHPMKDCYNFIHDYSDNIALLVEHLVDTHGCKRINFMGGYKENDISNARIEAYKSALVSRGIPVEEDRIGYGEFWSEPTRRAMDKFKDSDLPFPDAIVCANDAMAIAVVQYLDEIGYSVPDDVKVTGFDGIAPALEHLPPITTVKFDEEQTARKAFALMADIFQGNTVPKESPLISEILFGGSCGCHGVYDQSYNRLVSDLHAKLDDHKRFTEVQITMAADLTDNDSFHGVFSNVLNYASEFCSNKFWMCIIDDFLNEQEELSDIIVENKGLHRVNGYPSKMDLMLSCIDGEQQGLIDFNTADMLPNLPEIFETSDCIMFLPLHILDRTVGYVALAYDKDLMNIGHLYQFLMNISNALAATKTNMRQRNIIATLENKYIHDPMTGLFNRRGFYQRVEPMWQDCIDNNRSLVVVSADLNGLKPINDTYGHGDGDIAISTVGHALSAVTDITATCARFGGDEFIASWVCERDSEEEERIFREKMQEFLDKFNVKSGKPYQVSTSIGIVIVVPNKELTLDTLIKVADEKMYEEKVSHHLQRK